MGEGRVTWAEFGEWVDAISEARQSDGTAPAVPMLELSIEGKAVWCWAHRPAPELPDDEVSDYCIRIGDGTFCLDVQMDQPALDHQMWPNACAIRWDIPTDTTRRPGEAPDEVQCGLWTSDEPLKGYRAIHIGIGASAGRRPARVQASFPGIVGKVLQAACNQIMALR